MQQLSSNVKGHLLGVHREHLIGYTSSCIASRPDSSTSLSIPLSVQLLRVGVRRTLALAASCVSCS